jgi:hypothetical protein
MRAQRSSEANTIAAAWAGDVTVTTVGLGRGEAVGAGVGDGEPTGTAGGDGEAVGGSVGGADADGDAHAAAATASSVVRTSLAGRPDFIARTDGRRPLPVPGIPP